MAYCRKCGEELPEDAEFCPNCGVPTTRPAPIKLAPTPKRAPPARQPAKMSRRPNAITVDAALFIIFGALSAVIGIWGIFGGLAALASPAVTAQLGTTTVGALLGLSLFSASIGFFEAWCGEKLLKMLRSAASIGLIILALGICISAISSVLDPSSAWIYAILGIIPNFLMVIPIVYYWKEFV